MGPLRSLSYEERKKRNIIDLSVCIWGDGPGRPYDNSYILTRKEFDKENNIIHLYFDDNEECIIYNPQDIIYDEILFKIKRADKIIWKSYSYSRPQSNETLYTDIYTMLNNNKVHAIVEYGTWKRNEIIDIKNNYAFDCVWTPFK
jgi:hypothetical protein